MSAAEELKHATDEQLDELQLQHEIQRERRRRHARRVVDSEEQPPHEPLKALTVTELFAQRSPDYLIDQLLPERALAELVGDSETLKSFFAIDIGASIAAGQSEFFGLAVVKHGAVLYIAAEGGGAFQYRLRAWAQAHRVDMSRVPFYTVIAPLNLRDETFQAELRNLVTDIKPVLLIVDTLHRAMPGAEENSSKDLGEVIAFASDLNTTHSVAVLFLHHPPKNAPGGRGRGSSALYYAADTELSAELIDEDTSTGIKVVEVTVKKQKDDAKLSFTLKNRIMPVYNEHGRPLAYASGRAIHSCVLEQVGDAEAETIRAAEDAKDAVVRWVADHPNASKNAIVAGIGGNKQKVLGLIDALIAGGRLLKVKGKISVNEVHERLHDVM